MVGEHSVRVSYGSSEPMSENAPNEPVARRKTARSAGVDVKLPGNVIVSEGENDITLELP